MCELSTPFLNLRWLFKCVRCYAASCFAARVVHAVAYRHDGPPLRSLQKRSPAVVARAATALGLSSHARLIFIIDLLFAATFLGMRVVGYGAGLAHTLHAARRHFFSPLPHAAAGLMLLLICLGFALNLMWARLLLAGLARARARAAADDKASTSAAGGADGEQAARAKAAS